MNNFVLYNLKYKKPENIYKDVAQLLVQNKIVGCFSGKAEFGPRTLGNRSILANPSNADNKDIVNIKIKQRESFRPFAPTVLEMHAEKYFNTGGRKFPYMIVTVNTKKEKRK